MPRWLAPLAIAAVGLLAYSNSFEVPFVFDDNRNITANPHVHWRELSWEALRDAATRSPLDRPVAYLSFGLDHYLGGSDPRGYHAVNLLIHVLNGLLVHALALHLLRRSRGLPEALLPGAALCAALVFVAHPIQTQAVTYLVQRMTSLATGFYLLAFWLYLAGRDAAAGRRRALSWGAALGCWLLALGTKEIAATWPVAILLYEGCLRRELTRSQLAAAALAIALGGAVLAFVYLGGDPLGKVLRDYSRRDFSLGERLLTQPRVIFLYLGLVAWPLPGRLNLIHEVAPSSSLLDPATTLPALAGLAGLGLLGAWLARNRPLPGFCILWVLLHLALESSVFALEIAYEHRMYLPMVGVALLLARGLAALPRRPAVLAAGVLVAALASATWLRNRVWADEIALWSDVLAKNPTSYRAHDVLGTRLAATGRLEEAIVHHREALRLRPDSADTLVNLGADMREAGRLEEAVGYYRMALRHAPDHAEAHNNLGVVLARLERHEEAARHYREALRLSPGDPEVHNNFGVMLSRLGRHDEAIEHYEQALRAAPQAPRIHNNLGAALLRRGDARAALPHFEQAIELAPDYPEPRHNREVARGMLAQPADAGEGGR